MGEFPSGQRGQTVNLLSAPSVVRIHLLPPKQRRHPKGCLFCIGKKVVSRNTAWFVVVIKKSRQTFCVTYFEQCEFFGYHPQWSKNQTTQNIHPNKYHHYSKHPKRRFFGIVFFIQSEGLVCNHALACMSSHKVCM